MSVSIQVGDALSIDGLPDRRNWWQRHAPKWLGGRDAPPKRQHFVVTNVVTA